MRRPRLRLGRAALLSVIALSFGCDAEPPTGSSLVLTLEPETLVLPRGETRGVTVSVLRLGSGEGSIQLFVEDPPADIGSTPVSLAAGAAHAQLELTAAPDAALADHLVVVRAEGDGVAGTGELDLKVVHPPPRLDAVEVEGRSATEVRQGMGAIRLALSGRNLAQIEVVTVGDLEVAGFEALGDTLLSVEADVPHGAAIGPRTLAAEGDGGRAELPDALAVTAVTVSPSGDDDGGGGTDAEPFRSLTRALVTSGGGDTIVLRPGRYDSGSGEEGAVLSGRGVHASATANVPADVRIVGAGAGETVLAGSHDGEDVVALVFAGSGVLTGVTLEGFGRAVHAAAGEVHLRDVVVRDNLQHGLVAAGDVELRLSGSTLERNGASAVHVRDSATVVMVDVALSGTGQGDVLVQARGTSHVRLEGVRMHDSAICAEAIGGVRLDLVDTQVRGCATGVVSARRSLAETSSDEAVLELLGSTIEDVGVGVTFSGADLRVRGSTVEAESTGFFIAGHPDSVDLAAPAQPSDNRFRGGDLVVHDARPPRAEPGGVAVIVRAADLADAPPESGVFVGPHDAAPSFMIEGANNLVQLLD